MTWRDPREKPDLGPLFDFSAAAQQEELERVTARIGMAVLRFYTERLPTNPTFHMEELTDAIRAATTVAPDSPGRILRDLRQRRHINYVVLDRSKSLYRFLEVPE